MEFKYKECPPDISEEKKLEIYDAVLKNGMGQIKEKGYAKRYTGGGKKVYQAAFAIMSSNTTCRGLFRSLREKQLAKNL